MTLAKARARQKKASAQTQMPVASASALLAWYDRHRRRLPWRAENGARPDPYAVWLSEIMLQQTTVKAVAPYYARFLSRWPTVSDLVYVFGPDLGGRRIEELADPSKLAKQATDRVVEGVIERSGLPVSEPEPAGQEAPVHGDAPDPSRQAKPDDAAPEASQL